MESFVVILIHGFLGQVQDWQSTIQFLSEQPRIEDVIAFSLEDIFGPGCSLPEAGRRVNREVRAVLAAKAVDNLRPVLVAYSLGARIGIHALFNEPKLYSGAMFVSAHPGLSDPQAKAERGAADAQWAAAFLTDNWTELMARWEKQEVFKNSRPMTGRTDQDRGLWAQMLRSWSVATQADFRAKLCTPPCPVLWLVGEEDLKFKELAMTLQIGRGDLLVETLAGAGHRVPWDLPELFHKRLYHFVLQLAAQS